MQCWRTLWVPVVGLPSPKQRLPTSRSCCSNRGSYTCKHISCHVSRSTEAMEATDSGEGDPANSTTRYIPKRTENSCLHNLGMNVHNSMGPKSPNVETTQMFIHWWVDKNEMYHTMGYSAVKSTDTCHSVNYENMLSEKKSDTKGHRLHESIYIKFSRKGKFRETESRLMTARAGEREERWITANGHGWGFISGMTKMFWD